MPAWNVAALLVIPRCSSRMALFAEWVSNVHEERVRRKERSCISITPPFLFTSVSSHDLLYAIRSTFDSMPCATQCLTVPLVTYDSGHPMSHPTGALSAVVLCNHMFTLIPCNSNRRTFEGYSMNKRLVIKLLITIHNDPMPVQVASCSGQVREVDNHLQAPHILMSTTPLIKHVIISYHRYSLV